MVLEELLLFVDDVTYKPRDESEAHSYSIEDVHLMIDRPLEERKTLSSYVTRDKTKNPTCRVYITEYIKWMVHVLSYEQI